jgi:hypothetical protein
MAKVWITEFANLAYDEHGNIMPCPLVPARRTTVVDFTAGAALMAQAIGDDCALIAVCADANCHINTTPFAAPVAASVASSKRIPANTIVHFGILPGNAAGVAIGAVAATS